MMTVLVLCISLQDLPVPSDEAQKEAEKLVREVFADEYAKPGAPERKALAAKLLQQGRETSDDRAAQFVLFREARDLATALGDAELAFEAIGEIAKIFLVDARAMKFAALGVIAKKSETRDVAARYAALADEALEADEYDVANQAASAALAIAKKIKDSNLSTKFDARLKKISEIRALFDQARTAREILVKQPADPNANLDLGRFLCFAKGRWDEGLPFLSKSDDPVLKPLADRERAKPEDASGQAALGDGWWDLGDAHAGLAKTHLRARAAHWYRMCAPKLAGLTRKKVDKRLSELGIEAEDDRWVDLTDARLYGREGKRGEPILIQTEPGKADAVWIREMPKGSFDGISARIDFGTSRIPSAGFVLEDKQKMIYVAASSESVLAAHFDSSRPAWVADLQAKCGRRSDYVLTVLLEDGIYVVSVDGEEKLRVRTDLKELSFAGLQACEGPARFHSVRARRKR